MRREADPRDRRAQQVVITREGVALLRRMWPIYERGIAEHFAAQLDRPPAELRDTLRRVAGSARGERV